VLFYDDESLAIGEISGVRLLLLLASKFGATRAKGKD